MFTKMFRMSFIIGSCVFVLLLSCNVMAQCVLARLDVNPQAMTVESSGENVSIDIQSLDGHPWCVSSNGSQWIRPSYACGEGSKSITLSIDRNMGEIRKANLLITTDSFDYFTRYIVIHQKEGNIAKEPITLSKARAKFEETQNEQQARSND
jgi:hypothetical protein